jgi:hypothetical protein
MSGSGRRRTRAATRAGALCTVGLAAVAASPLAGGPPAVASPAPQDRAIRALAPGQRNLLAAPLWHPGQGQRVLRYLGAHRAQVERAGGRRGLLESALPLRMPRRDGTRAPVRLTLRRAGTGFAPANPIVRLRVPARAGGAIVLPRSGVRMRVSPVASRSRGRLVNGRAVYEHAAPDTDLIVTPLAQGVQTFANLRSARSPERVDLRFALAKGARLVPSRSAVGGFAVRRGGREIARIGLPAAVDAAGRAVKTSFVLERDRLAIHVAHRGAGVRYPVLLDPPVTENFKQWRDGSASDFVGWDYFRTPSASDNTRFKMGKSGYLGNGLYIYNRGATQYSTSDYAQWTFNARGYGDGYVYRADFHNLYKQGYGTPPLAPEEVHVGIYNLRRSGWEAGSPATLSGNDYLYSSRQLCVKSDCSYRGINPGGGTLFNRAVFELRPLTSGEHRDFTAYLGGAEIFEADDVLPTGTSSLPTAWVRSASNLTSTFTDTGLGMRSVRLDTVPSHAWNQAPSRNAEASCSGDRNTPCPKSLTATFDSGDLPDGTNTLKFTGIDVMGDSASVTGTLKVDRQPPQVTLLGDLADAADGQSLFQGGDADLLVRATDGLSGAVRSQILIDGASPAAAADKSQSCGADGGCPLDHDYLQVLGGLSPGDHTVTSIVTDAAGNQARSDWHIDVEEAQGIPPDEDPAAPSDPPQARAAAAAQADPSDDEHVGCEAAGSPVPFDHYSLGALFEGMAVSAALRRCDQQYPGELGRANYVTYIYGDCAVADLEEDDARCVPPLEVQSWPSCERALPDYDFGPGDSPLGGVDPPVSRRGVPSTLFEDALRAEVYTGAATVVIFGVDPTQVSRAVDQIRKEASDPPATPALGAPAVLGNLAAPVPGAMDGSLSCLDPAQARTN